MAKPTEPPNDEDETWTFKPNCRFGEVDPPAPRHSLLDWQAHPGTHTESIEKYVRRLQENPGLLRPRAWPKSGKDPDAPEGLPTHEDRGCLVIDLPPGYTGHIDPTIPVLKPGVVYQTPPPEREYYRPPQWPRLGGFLWRIGLRRIAARLL